MPQTLRSDTATERRQLHMNRLSEDPRYERYDAEEVAQIDEVLHSIYEYAEADANHTEDSTGHSGES